MSNSDYEFWEVSSDSNVAPSVNLLKSIDVFLILDIEIVCHLELFRPFASEVLA